MSGFFGFERFSVFFSGFERFSVFLGFERFFGYFSVLSGFWFRCLTGSGASRVVVLAVLAGFSGFEPNSAVLSQIQRF